MSHYLIIVPTTKITRESSCAVGWNWYMYSSAKWHNAWPIWGKGFNRKGKTASTCLTPIFLVTMVLDILCHYTRTFTNSHILATDSECKSKPLLVRLESIQRICNRILMISEDFANELFDLVWTSDFCNSPHCLSQTRSHMLHTLHQGTIVFPSSVKTGRSPSSSTPTIVAFVPPGMTSQHDDTGQYDMQESASTKSKPCPA